MRAGALLRHRRFGPFFWTQFLGALNDNVFRNALVVLFTFGAAARRLTPDVLVNLASGVFVLPFFLFSATAGQLADKVEKTRIIRMVKLFEIAIMCFGAFGFALESASLLLVALFLMGTHSAVFGPVKFSILPQHLREEELVAGNALVEMGTFGAILLGTVLGGVLVAIAGVGPAVASAATIGLAVAGWAMSRWIPPAPAADPGLRIRWNPVVETWRLLGVSHAVPGVWVAILGISWFWCYGTLLLALFPGLGRDLLDGDAHVVTLLLGVFSIGVGVGSLLCERLSGDVVELGLVPLGALGLTLFALDLAHAAPLAGAAGGVDVAGFAASPRHWRVALDLVALGASGGLFVVPLLAFVQQRSDPAHRSRVIAANNVVNAFAMVGAAGLGIALRTGGVTIPQLLVLTAVLNAAAALSIVAALPEVFLRLVVWLLVHTACRVAPRGLEHLPPDGAALVVSNHVGALDALVIASTSRRPIRFIVDRAIDRPAVVSVALRAGRAIPIATGAQDPSLRERAHDDVAAALAAGELVCVTGGVGPFGPDVARILARTPVPVVPMALRRVGGPVGRRLASRLRSRIDVICGPPLAPADATAEALRARVCALVS